MAYYLGCYVVKGAPKTHPWLTDDEKKYILSGQRNQDINEDGSYDEGYTPSTGQLFKHKESWGVIIASAAIDPIWWLFIVWIPIYLSEVFGMDVKEIAFLCMGTLCWSNDWSHIWRVTCQKQNKSRLVCR